MGISLSQWRATIGLRYNKYWRTSAQVNSGLHYLIGQTCLNNKNKLLGLINIVSLISITLGLGATILSKHCLQVLLIMSGIEQNPGPDTSKDILEELCSTSSDEQVKRVLSAYPLGVALTSQKTAIGKFKKEEILATLQFLKVSDQEGYNKPKLLHNLIVRIQNLLPDTCGLCKQEYNTRLDDEPLLSCEVCGQGSHDPCIKHILGESDTGSLDSKAARKLIIPLDLAGVHYLCMSCSTQIIPREKEIIPEKTDHETPEGNNPGATPASQPPGEPSTPVNLPEQGPSSVQPVPGSDGSSQPQPASSPEAMDNRPICRFHKKNQCRYGQTGRGCKYQHPQLCKKLLRYGASHPNGCTLGRARCDKWHPSMCPDSMTKGHCMTTSCNYWHVAGTKRTASNVNMTGTRTPASNMSSFSGHQSGTKNQTAKRTANKELPSDFLGLLQSWKVEMMEAMDMKLAMAIKSPPIAIPSPSPTFSTEPLSMMASNQLIPQNYYNLALGGQRGLIAQPLVPQMVPNTFYR